MTLAIEERPLLQRWPRPLRWILLAAAAVVVSLGLEAAGFPAAFLLGPMVAAVIFGIAGSGLRLPRPLFLLAQGVAGTLIARSLTPSILLAVAADWPLLIFSVAATLGFSCIAGLLVSRIGGVSLETAIWGSLPGMSGAMVIMAEERGVDARLVAFMQYVRLAGVILAISLISHALNEAGTAPAVAWMPPGGAPWPSVALSLAIAATGLAASRLAWFPAAGMIFPMLIGTLLEAAGLFQIVLPLWVVVPAFSLIGFDVGLKFSRETVTSVIRLSPLVLFATGVLILLSAGLAVLLTHGFGTGLLTAMLATAPGSIDSVAIVAVNSSADIPFVMALQTVRMFVVVLTAPLVVREMLRLAGRPAARRRS